MPCSCVWGKGKLTCHHLKNIYWIFGEKAYFNLCSEGPGLPFMIDLEPDTGPSDTEGCLVDAELLDLLVMEVFSMAFGKHSLLQ